MTESETTQARQREFLLNQLFIVPGYGPPASGVCCIGWGAWIKGTFMPRKAGTAGVGATGRWGQKMAVAAMLIGLVAIQTASAHDFSLLKLDGAFIKWGEPHFATGATVSYALLKDNRHDPGAINCKEMTGPNDLLGRAGLDMATFAESLKGALSMWHSAADITFVPAASPATADILIGAQAQPRGIAYTNIHSEPVPASPFARLGQATVCLNPRAAWRAGGKGDGETKTYELRQVLAHELGHAIGLDHPGPRGELMAYTYQDTLDRLTDGDIAGIVTLYGVPPPAAAFHHLNR